MYKILLTSLIICPSFLFAQKTKMIKSESGKEKYEVLASDMKTKHGRFLIYGGGKDIAVKGFYNHNLKDSVWTIYNYKGEIEAELGFSNDTLVAFKRGAGKEDLHAKAILEEGEVDSVLTRPPYFLYGERYLLTHLMENIRYPEKAKDNGKMGTVFVCIIIDKTGNATDFKVINPIGYGLDDEAIRVLKILPNLWIPATNKKSNVAAEVHIPIRFVLR